MNDIDYFRTSFKNYYIIPTEKLLLIGATEMMKRVIRLLRHPFHP
jgi:hypothetical protein